MFKVMYEAYNNVLFTPSVSVDSDVDASVYAERNTLVLITPFTVADPGFPRRKE